MIWRVQEDDPECIIQHGMSREGIGHAAPVSREWVSLERTHSN